MGHELKLLENTVYLDTDGVIHSIHRGLQSTPDILLSRSRLLRIMEMLIAEDRPVLMIVDIRNSSHHDNESRIEAMRSRTILPFWKAAFIITREVHAYELISRKLSDMTGRKKEIRYFVDEDDAMEWLRSSSPMREGR